ncbi:ADP-ribosylglycohydrolase [Algoriphagus boseongensis]|uniref:ADP-ribosylglycohydrolase n=1 Tax=Algoriphagus boseongensis TaxID=1442587 RepID=A0A4R6T754_9BACT|nr:ADP-ribosylglycohydrolase family protein [Algoriphagus boseongensis]TDQ18820.1 ADP-ribosylglycohydrolase [Algoriphagus boseongensis]
MKKYIPVILFLGLFACNQSSVEREEHIDKLQQSGLSEEELYDKVLGMLVGSAIGDAMGAPTEMWSRENIALEYGYVTDLDSMIREVSPEGIWIANLPAGGTTDDTRWKVLATDYLLTQSGNRLNSKDFASQILKTYEKSLEKLKAIDSNNPQPYESALLEVNWLSEWAKVSQPFLDDNLPAFADSLSKFYGGEMVCAGLLYAPAIGMYFPGNPEKAYSEGYKLTLYDLGYARDISSLAMAMTAAGMKKDAKKEDLLAALRLDPEKYFESRLVGRTSHKILKDALWINEESKKLDSLESMTSNSPALLHAFQLLDQKQQDMPFHAGEIYLQSLTAMVYADFDFKNSLIFLVNYGRDNDTTAALVGGILGSWYGFEQLPEKEKWQVLKVNKEILGIDLEEKAKLLTAHMIKK